MRKGSGDDGENISFFIFMKQSGIESKGFVFFAQHFFKTVTARAPNASEARTRAHELNPIDLLDASSIIIPCGFVSRQHTVEAFCKTYDEVVAPCPRLEPHKHSVDY